VRCAQMRPSAPDRHTDLALFGRLLACNDVVCGSWRALLGVAQVRHHRDVASRVIMLRNIQRVLWLLLAAALFVEAGIVARGYAHDHVPVDRATYVGTFMAAVVAAITVLRRIARDPSDSVLRLQERLTLSLQDRLDHLLLTPNEIQLIVASSAIDDLRDLQGFVDAVAGGELPRVLLTGTRGGGKSYVVLRVAQKIITSTDRLPIVVPLSRWADGNDIETFLSDFLHDEFNLSRRTQQLLLAQARIVPIFDGLDEIPDLPRRAAILVDFVQQLRMWRPVPDGIRYVVSNP
jgi:NACHT domain-containing protein